MSTVKSVSVMETRGNVVFCNFGEQTRNSENTERDLPAVLAAVSSTVAGINGDTREILGANLATAQVGVDNSNALFVTLGRIDNLAFQCNAIAVDNGRTDGDQCGVGRIADDVHGLVAKAADATRRLRALVNEQKHMAMAAGSVLREIAEEVAEIEAKARVRIEPVHAQIRQAELANYCNYAGGIEP
jgi:hypothetical protein